MAKKLIIPDRCKKCGLPSDTSTLRPPPAMIYQKDTDMIKFICSRCGYEWEQEPIDRKEKN